MMAAPPGPPAPPPDPAIACLPVGTAAEARRRFELCKSCDQAERDAFACALKKGCCFGRWRAVAENHCPAGRW